MAAVILLVLVLVVSALVAVRVVVRGRRLTVDAPGGGRMVFPDAASAAEYVRLARQAGMGEQDVERAATVGEAESGDGQRSTVDPARPDRAPLRRLRQVDGPLDGPS